MDKGRGGKGDGVGGKGGFVFGVTGGVDMGRGGNGEPAPGVGGNGGLKTPLVLPYRPLEGVDALSSMRTNQNRKNI